MYKKLLTLIIVLSAATAYANPYNTPSRCPKVYIGTSTGLNNHSGLLGFNIDVPVTEQFSLGTGAGISSWGYKGYFEGRFYFRECNRGWAIGTGATINTGLSSINLDLPTTVGDQSVTLELQPVPNIFFCGYHFFNLGRGGHRFYLQAGWSQRLIEDPYVVKSNHTLNSDGELVMQLLSPGGIIFGFGFSFGIGSR